MSRKLTVSRPKSALHTLRLKYLPLIKSLQTGLLLSTGLAGYLSAHPRQVSLAAFLALVGSLSLSISGGTVLNMWYDRDIDAKMKRTCTRPLSTGMIGPVEALWLGLVLSAAGVGWALALSPSYGLAVLAGLFFDVVVYTIWLKRRTAWSIVWGGVSGSVPILAGRVLATDRVDWIGALLALAVLFWIPTHILTFNMRYFDDYQHARVPTFPSVVGFQATRWIIAMSSLVSALAMGMACFGVGLTAGYLRLLLVLSTGLLVLALTSVFRPSERVNFGVFKYASLYMLSSMLLMMIRAL